jgi:peptidoglycan hydrolase-like protein with peptidoglycan-binding domain
MPDITKSVGEGASSNAKHDVAMVEAMLRVVKNSKGHPYLGGQYDGTFANQTKQAIRKFQNEHGTAAAVPAAGQDKLGVIAPAGPTIKKLDAMLPATHKTLRIIPNTTTVYLEDSRLDMVLSWISIVANENLNATFRASVGDLVSTMFSTHKIVLWVTDSGWRRTFAEQAALDPSSTKAGPGESNHNFGRAVDLGFSDFRWIQGNGSIRTDNDWLGRLAAVSSVKANAFWDARDAIALNPPVSLFRLQFERIHLQSFDDSTVSMVKSLAALLTAKGAMTWEPRYKCDLGGGGALFPVGDAKQIWAGNASVSKAEIAAAKGVKASTITAKDVADMRKALKADFEAADTNWKSWTAVPK